MSTSGVGNVFQYPNLIDRIAFELSLIQHAEPYTILDIGCGRGMLGYMMKAYLARDLILHGIEPDTSFHRFLTQVRVYDYLWRMDVQTFRKDSHPNCLFDVIIANHIFEHIPETEALPLIAFFRSRCEAMILGFPRAQGGYQYKITDTDLHTHKWACDEKKMASVGFSKAYFIRNHELYIWRKNSGDS